MRKSVIISAALLLGGCNFAPQHVRPASPSPELYPSAYSADTAGRDAPHLSWREFIVDPRLKALIAAALENNRDLRMAIARIDEARGLYRIQGADLFPSVVAGADASRTGGAAGTATVDRFAVSVGVTSYELDFWGRIRNLSEAARAQFLATVEAQRAFRLSLIGQVASTYLSLLEARERIALAEGTVATRREGLEIASTRLEAGITSALDYRQAEALLMQAETELAGLRLIEARANNALAVLVGGQLPDSLPPGLTLREQSELTPIAAGLPSSLLTVRPDIIAAEEQLRAARASIGAARAAFFPSISLTGLFGFASNELDGLFSEENRTWSFGPQIVMPLFTGGKLKGNLTVARAREHIAVANYERTVQEAFREVADALAGRKYLADQVAAQERSLEAQRQISELAATRYNEGVVGYLEVLDAERNLFNAEQALLQFRRAEAENLIRLYLALGGGVISE
jgi:multidrug efflux system outer membrane protein